MQNLFDGFGTTNKVDYQEARILVAAYNYIEKSNDIGFQMTNAYLNVLRSYELLQKNNTWDIECNFRCTLGRMPEVEILTLVMVKRTQKVQTLSH